MSAKIQPLYELTKKNKTFVWTAKCQETFELSKAMLLESPMLTIYDPKLPIGVVCDANSYGVGGVLFHIINEKEKPVKICFQFLVERRKEVFSIRARSFGNYFYYKKVP